MTYARSERVRCTSLASALRNTEQARGLVDAERARSGSGIPLQIDGGIMVDDIRRVADAAADALVAGSAIFGKADYLPVIDALRAERVGAGRTDAGR